MGGLDLGGTGASRGSRDGQLDSIFGGRRRADEPASPAPVVEEQPATEPEPTSGGATPAAPDQDGMSRLWAIESQLRLLDARVRRMGAQVERLLGIVSEQQGVERRAAPRTGPGVEPHLTGRRASDHDAPSGGAERGTAPGPDDVGPMFRR